LQFRPAIAGIKAGLSLYAGQKNLAGNAGAPALMRAPIRAGAWVSVKNNIFAHSLIIIYVTTKDENTQGRYRYTVDVV
jgi:hypothetical protein